MPINEHGQPIGEPVPAWRMPARPERRVHEGRFARLEPLEPARHGDDLHRACCDPANDAGWTYLPVGPFAEREAYLALLSQREASTDPLFFAIIDRASGRAVGEASYLRIDPEGGCIEVGHLHFGPAMRRGRVATEAMTLMMAHAFELGYRRYEWKCDALNAPSRQAATRLGFTFEGLFRQARVVKGRNRDTAWYAIVDRDWPAVRAAHGRWLDDANFDADGRQRIALAALTADALQRTAA
ncbi:MAG: GNAT family protein [Burkholderiaceae bacterium]